jgi:hypothetical protein
VTKLAYQNLRGEELSDSICQYFSLAKLVFKIILLVYKMSVYVKLSVNISDNQTDQTKLMHHISGKIARINSTITEI